MVLDIRFLEEYRVSAAANPALPQNYVIPDLSVIILQCLEATYVQISGRLVVARARRLWQLEIVHPKYCQSGLNLIPMPPGQHGLNFPRYQGRREPTGAAYGSEDSWSRKLELGQKWLKRPARVLSRGVTFGVYYL